MFGRRRVTLLSALLVVCTTTGPASAHPPALDATAAPPVTRTVLVTSVDGLTSRVLRDLGRKRLPTLHRLLRGGAATLNARTEREQTETLPNHTGIVTGRRIDVRHGGHGVTWNDERRRPRTVQRAAGHPVASVFSVLHGADRSAALFVSKAKLRLFERSWPAGVGRFVLRQSNARLVQVVRNDLQDRRRSFRFVHLSKPDVADHAQGFRSRAYRRAVVDVDRLLGRILLTVRHEPRLSDGLTWILTTDHGGPGQRHVDPSRLADYRVPFLVWGAGVA